MAVRSISINNSSGFACAYIASNMYYRQWYNDEIEIGRVAVTFFAQELQKANEIYTDLSWIKYIVDNE